MANRKGAKIHVKEHKTDVRKLARNPNNTDVNGIAKEALEEGRLQLKDYHQVNEVVDGHHALWYLKTRQIHKAHGFNNPVYWVSYARNGRFFATAGHDKHCAIWETLLFKCHRRIRNHSGPVRQCVFSPDSTMIATVAEAILYVWLVESGENLVTVREMHEDLINSVDWSLNGNMLATAGNDKQIKIWSVNKLLGPPTIDRGCVLTCSTGHNAHLARIHRVAFSPNSEFVISASADCSVKMWGLLRMGRHERTFTRHTDSVLGLSWNSDGTRFASASHDGTIVIWNPESPTPMRIMNGTGDVFYTGVFGPEANRNGGRLISVGHFPQLTIWNSRTGRKMNVFKVNPKGWTISATFSPDGKKLITTSTEGANSIIIYDAQPTFKGFWAFVLWIARTYRVLRT